MPLERCATTGNIVRCAETVGVINLTASSNLSLVGNLWKCWKTPLSIICAITSACSTVTLKILFYGRVFSMFAHYSSVVMIASNKWGFISNNEFNGGNIFLGTCQIFFHTIDFFLLVFSGQTHYEVPLASWYMCRVWRLEARFVW